MHDEETWSDQTRDISHQGVSRQEPTHPIEDTRLFALYLLGGFPKRSLCAEKLCTGYRTGVVI